MASLSREENDLFHTCFKQFEQKMVDDSAPAIVINAFKKHLAQFIEGNQACLAEDDIAPVFSHELPSLHTMDRYKDDGIAALPNTAIIKLNGGLGTSMGLDGPKSFLPIKEGRTFLDLILSQVELMRTEFGAQLPLLFMNSYWTEEQTNERLKNVINGDPNIPLSFQQHRYPRIRVDNMSPLQMEGAPEYDWNPPGHGDIYTSLLTSGLMRRLLLLGYRYVFVSNSDNLGAIFNPALLGYMVRKKIPFLMEVCERTSQDRKGGHLVKRLDGTLGLREVSQCAPKDMDAFQDINKYSFFNTNSIWLDLKAVEEAFLKHREFSLQLIVNPKRAIPGDLTSPEIVQLETAMGSAISLFPGAGAVVVPRSRFSPVKTISDLMLTMSDCFHVTDQDSIVCKADWQRLPNIRLDPEVYTTIGDFFSRFPDGVPSLANCRELSILGDVCLHRDVELSGTVKIVNKSKQQVTIPPGRALSGELAL
ncbi:UTP--glucose-1-phosphate uridylyltransferase [Pseudodesulfovibrio sediminis]|uniref:UTP--glucose-1-phosphate uridylyltransferase n=1 Tax=Pseudodesulfovibrio sediminis TaxID=2810563 RepID=A0ABM7P7Y4_9BACT|nr:UTP--glucose-1-phosphate uridylyltransferase [Pseudodesulfovibrio sediminis]BCS89120.1 UTP--glucose-1-phosphate uridylyltransferase [Pseudodesulfovibrio sediminis]